MIDDPNPTSRLAAIVFDRHQDPDAPLRDFVRDATRRGIRVAGLMQERDDTACCDARDIHVRDLASGTRLAIMQDLGSEAIGCRIDPVAIAKAAVLLNKAVATQPDLLLVNRFGHLESEGSGLLPEVGEAFASGLAVLVCVPLRYRDAWDAFASGLDVKLPPQRAAIERWWDAVAPPVAESAIIRA